MAKIGGRDYPSELDPEESENIADVLVNQFGGEAESKEAFAQAIGHSTANSGTYMRKVGDARKYGIITARGLRATKLGRRVANPRSEKDRSNAKLEMLENVSLLSDINSSLNGNEPPGEFWRILADVSDANPKEAKEAAPRLKELYKEMRKLRNQKENSSVETPTKSVKGSLDVDTNSAPDVVGEVNSKSEPAIHVKIGEDELRFSEVNDANIDLAQRFLNSKKKEKSKSDPIQGFQAKFE